jgi:hypothetical protein
MPEISSVFQTLKYTTVTPIFIVFSKKASIPGVTSTEPLPTPFSNRFKLFHELRQRDNGDITVTRETGPEHVVSHPESPVCHGGHLKKQPDHSA